MRKSGLVLQSVGRSLRSTVRHFLHSSPGRPRLCRGASGGILLRSRERAGRCKPRPDPEAADPMANSGVDFAPITDLTGPTYVSARLSGRLIRDPFDRICNSLRVEWEEEEDAIAICEMRVSSSSSIGFPSEPTSRRQRSRSSSFLRPAPPT